MKPRKLKDSFTIRPGQRDHPLHREHDVLVTRHWITLGPRRNPWRVVVGVHLEVTPEGDVGYSVIGSDLDGGDNKSVTVLGGSRLAEAISHG